MARFLSLVLATAFASVLSAQPCGTGLQLELTGGRLGDAFALGVIGPPNAPGLLGIAPTTTAPNPLGLCIPLGETSILPIALGGSGLFVLSGVLSPDPVISGVSFSFQAAVIDSNLSGGFGLTDAESVRLASPRLYLVDSGQALVTPPVPSNVTCVRALDGGIEWQTPFLSVIRDVVRLAGGGLLAVLLSDGSIRFLDEVSGVEMATTGPVASTVVDLAPAPDGSATVLALDAGGGGANVRVIDANTGVVSSSIPLAAAAKPPLVPVPGTPVVYVYSGGAVVPVDTAAGVTLSSTPLPSYASGILDAVIEGGEAMLLLRGTPATPFNLDGPGGLFAMNTGSHLGIAGRTLQFATAGLPRNILRRPNGYYVNVAALPDIILRVQLTTLTVNGALSLGTTTSSVLASSTLDTEILVLGGGDPATPGFLARLNTGVLSLTGAVPLPSETQPAFAPLVSDTVSKAFVVSGAATLLAIDTDPITGPAVATPLPVGTGFSRILQDR